MNGLPARRMPSSLSCHPADRSELPGGPPDAESDTAPAHTNSAKEGLDPGKSLQQGAGGVNAARPAGLGAGKAGSSAGTARDGAARAAVPSRARLPLLADPRSLLPIRARPSPKVPAPVRDGNGTGRRSGPRRAV